MAELVLSDWRDEFVLAAEMREREARGELERSVRCGSLVPVTWGVYRKADFLPQTRDDDDRFLALVRATHLVAPHPLVMSHLAASAAWGLPNTDRWPERVDVVDLSEAGGRSNRAVVRHAVPLLPQPVLRDGLWITDLARTVTDVLRTHSGRVSLAMVDAALRGDPRADRPPLSRDQVRAELDTAGRGRGTRIARRVLALGDARAESAGESLSRWVIAEAGFPEPILQQGFADSAGTMFADFWWPQFNLIGEFDGRGKYLKPELLEGRTPGAAVMAEKAREDRLRALGPRIVRWGWGTASRPGALISLLRSQLRP
jgi:hypothetical protein